MTIVAAIDDSDRSPTVFARASALAADLNEPLHAIHVLQRSEFVEVLDKDVEGQPFTENYEVRRVGEEIVERATTNPTVAHDSDAVETVVRVGDPAEELTSYTEEADARYLVVGGRRRSPTGKALFGSVTQQVMLAASVPVLNVPLDER